jgi:hypothetical protein
LDPDIRACTLNVRKGPASVIEQMSTYAVVQSRHPIFVRRHVRYSRLRWHDEICFLHRHGKQFLGNIFPYKMPLSYMFIICSIATMEHDDSPNSPECCLAGTYLSFTPVPMLRRRCNGWSPKQQERFIVALQAMGSVGPAAKAIGMNRASAYRLLDREGAESFAQAWERAIDMGRQRMFDYAMNRAINGVTTVTVRRGGALSVEYGPDMKLVQSAFRDAPLPPMADNNAELP